MVSLPFFIALSLSFSWPVVWMESGMERGDGKVF